MVINLGTTADVYRITGRSTQEVDDDSVVAFLQEADRIIQNQTSPQYMQDVFYANVIGNTGAANLVYSTYFPIQTGSSPSVYVDGVLKTESTDYTITDSTITFTSSSDVHYKAKIVIYYIPAFFDDYANYLASQRLFMTSLLDTDNAVAQTSLQNIQNVINMYVRTIASRPIIGRYTDHYERFNNVF